MHSARNEIRLTRDFKFGIRVDRTLRDALLALPQIEHAQIRWHAA